MSLKFKRLTGADYPPKTVPGQRDRGAYVAETNDGLIYITSRSRGAFTYPDWFAYTADGERVAHSYSLSKLKQKLNERLS